MMPRNSDEIKNAVEFHKWLARTIEDGRQKLGLSTADMRRIFLQKTLELDQAEDLEKG